jgi:hypothetical protein
MRIRLAVRRVPFRHLKITEPNPSDPVQPAATAYPRCCLSQVITLADLNHSKQCRHGVIDALPATRQPGLQPVLAPAVVSPALPLIGRLLAIRIRVPLELSESVLPTSGPYSRTRRWPSNATRQQARTVKEAAASSDLSIIITITFTREGPAGFHQPRQIAPARA